MDERRTYCIDSGWTNYFTISVPIGTNAMVFLTQAIYRVESLSSEIQVTKLASLEGDDTTYARYSSERYVAFRRIDPNSGGIRAMVITSYATVVEADT